MLPIVTDYFPTIEPQVVLYIRGKGEPLAFTKITFQNLSVKSLGEKFIAFLQTKKEEPATVVIKNNQNGIFNYISNLDLVAGIYEITPFLVNPDNNTELPGPPIQLLVNDSAIVKNMVVILNIMGLLIPILFLGVIIYFVPWYSWRKMHLMKEKMLLEEEKIELTAEELRRKPPTNDS